MLKRQICEAKALGGGIGVGDLVQVAVPTAKVCEICQGGRVEQKDRRGGEEAGEH